MRAPVDPRYASALLPCFMVWEQIHMYVLPYKESCIQYRILLGRSKQPSWAGAWPPMEVLRESQHPISPWSRFCSHDHQMDRSVNNLQDNLQVRSADMNGWTIASRVPGGTLLQVSHARLRRSSEARGPKFMYLVFLRFRTSPITFIHLNILSRHFDAWRRNSWRSMSLRTATVWSAKVTVVIRSWRLRMSYNFTLPFHF